MDHESNRQTARQTELLWQYRALCTIVHRAVKNGVFVKDNYTAVTKITKF